MGFNGDGLVFKVLRGTIVINTGKIIKKAKLKKTKMTLRTHKG